MKDVAGTVSGEQLDVDVGDGLRLHVARAGSGPPLLLLHGFTGSAETWTTLSVALGTGYAVITVDLPGHGSSSAPEDSARYSLDRFADDLIRVLDAIDVGRVVVLGYSLGGRAALWFALRHQERVSAMILESASAGIADDAERITRQASDDNIAEMLERDGIEAFVDYWQRLPLWASQKSLPAADRERLRVQRLAGDPLGLANSLRGAGAGSGSSVVESLRELEVPTLLVAGELDEKYVVAARAMETAMPMARTVIVPKAGHAAHLERPLEFCNIVANFLTEVASAGNAWR